MSVVVLIFGFAACDNPAGVTQILKYVTGQTTLPTKMSSNAVAMAISATTAHRAHQMFRKPER